MSMESTLTRMTDRFGTSVVLKATYGGSHGVDGIVYGQVTTNMTVRAVVREVTGKMIDGAAILAGDLLLMVPVQSTLTVAPKAGIINATIDGVVRICTGVRSYRISGTIYGYQLVMRGAA